MLVEVTEKDIRNGKPKDAKRCPIALALKRVDMRDVEVGIFNMGFHHGGRHYLSVGIPQKAYLFRRDYNEGKAVEPFAFTLDLEDVQ